MYFLRASIIFLGLFSLFTCDGQNQSDRIFSFENSRWTEQTWGTSTSGGVFKRDTIHFIDGRQSWLLTSEFNSGLFTSYVFQYFSLPIEAEEITLSIYSKSEIVNYAFLKLFCLDKEEKIVAKDSIRIISPRKWTQYSMSLKVPRSQKLYIEIHAKSKDTVILDGRTSQKFWIDKLQLKLNGHNFNSYPESKFQFSQSQIDEISDHIALNRNRLSTLNKIGDFKKHRIVAFGESVHGSSEMQHFSFDAIQHAISNENCKLVLFELPFEMGLRLNDFVSCETTEDLGKMLKFFNYDQPRIKSLFEWIRNYNQNSQTKVKVYGIDINHFLLMENNLYEFLQHQKVHNEALDSTIELIKREKYGDALNFALNNPSGFSFHNRIKYYDLIRALRYRCGALFPKPDLIEGNREYIMYDNAKYAIESNLKELERAVIYIHLGHANKINSPSTRFYIPCFGNYMNRQYREDYFVTALLAGEGTITNTDSIGYNSANLLRFPILGSLERLCLKTADNIFYKNLHNLQTIYSVRDIGLNTRGSQFSPYNHTGRFDAIVFFRHSNSYLIPKNWPKTNSSISKYIIDAQQKYRRNYSSDSMDN